MSQLVWMYEGKHEDKHGEQVVLVGDTVVDDVFGDVAGFAQTTVGVETAL